MRLGVRSSKSLRSHDTWVIGLLLRIFYKEYCQDLIIAWRISRTERISRPHTPPWWLAAGGLKYHWIFLRWSSRSILSLSQISNAFMTSVPAPLTFLPLLTGHYQLRGGQHGTSDRWSHWYLLSLFTPSSWSDIVPGADRQAVRATNWNPSTENSDHVSYFQFLSFRDLFIALDE